MKATWNCSDAEDGNYVGCIELEVDGEFHLFEIMQTDTRLVFGSACNTGFLESGYMEIDPCFSTDAHLQELIEDLEMYYRDGYEYTSHIICNARM